MLARDKEIYPQKDLLNYLQSTMEEQIELKAKIQNQEAAKCKEKSHELNVEAFLERVNKYSDIKRVDT